MPTYELTDDTTGMTIEVDGASELTESNVREYLGKARQQAASAIGDGSYKLDDETKLPLSKDQSRERLRKFSGYAMGISPDDVDIDSGASLWERTKMDFLPDEASRMEYLEKKYGAENVNALNVGGKTKMFYRDPKSNKMTMVDEMGASLADFTADIAGEAVTTAGAVGGAIAGTALAPGAGTGAGAVAGATAGAALGGFLTGVTQDVAAETLAGQEADLGEIAKTRAIEAGIGVPIDLATAGVGRIFARGIAGKGAKDLVGEFDTAAKRVDDLLAKEGASLPQVEALRTGAGSKQASEIAAARPTSKLAKELQSVRDRIGVLRESLEGKGTRGVSADEFNRISTGIGENYKKLIDEVGAVDKNLAKELTDQASRKMQKLSAPKVSEMQVGGRVQEILKRSEGQAGEINSANWQALDEAAAASGAKIPAWRLARAIRETAKDMEPKKNPALMALADEIAEKRGAGLNFSTVRDYLNRIDDAVPSSTEAGFKTAQQVAIAARKTVEGLRGELVERSGIKKQFQDTMDYYLNDYLNFKRQAVGGALRESTGAMTQPEIAVRGILSNGSSIKSALRAARQGGIEEERALKNELRELYLNRIGLVGDFDTKLNLSYSDDVVRELWGDRQLRELKNLQNRLKQMKDVDVIDLEPSDVNRYLSALSNNERSNIINQLKARGKANQRLDKVEVNRLTKMLAPQRGKRAGEWSEPEMTGVGLAEFANKFVSASTDQVKQAMKLIRAQKDPVGEQAFQQSYIGKLFDKFSGGAQVDRYGNPLWNPEAFEKAMKRGTKEYENAKAILGKDGVDDLLAANKVLLEAAETTGKDIQDIFQPRYSLTSGGLQLYGVGNLLGGLRGRAMAWAYSTKNGSRLMRFLTNPGTDEATERELRKLLPALMTSSGGLKAAAIQGQFDPEFTEAIAPLYQQQPE